MLRNVVRIYVECDGYRSRLPTLGIPQGSNFGPLCFISFINDFSIKLSNARLCHLLFAAVLKICAKILGVCLSQIYL